MIQSVPAQNMETLILYIYQTGHNAVRGGGVGGGEWGKKGNTLLFLRCGIVEGHSHKNICAEKKYDKNILLKAP